MHDTSNDKASILRARARELAREPAPEQPAGNVLSIVAFTLAEERYAFEAHHVSEVLPLEELVPLPCTPAFIAGLVNVRGKMTAVVNLKRFFDLPESGITDLHRIILLSDGTTRFGILADTVSDIRALPVHALQPTLPTLTDIRAEYLLGVTADRLVVLNAAAIISDSKLVVHEEVGS